MAMGRKCVMVTVCIGAREKLLRPVKTFAKLSGSTVEIGSDSIGARMQVDVRAQTAESFEADVLAVALPDNGSAPPNAPSPWTSTRGRLGRLAAEEEVAQAIGRTAVLHPNGELGARRVVAVGLGPAAEIDADALRTAAAAYPPLQTVSAEPWPGSSTNRSTSRLPNRRGHRGRPVLGAYDPGREARGEELPFERLILIGPDEAAEPARRALSVAEAANRARSRQHRRQRAHPEKLPRVHKTSHPSASTSPPRRWGPSRSSSSAWGRSPGSHREPQPSAPDRHAL